MTPFALTPYFHPTTVVFVDDNEAFLESLELELPRAWAYRAFTDPLEALDFLERPPDLEPLMDRCFTMQRGSHEAVIHLDLDLIEQEIKHRQRFGRNSVVVVDYSMPSMNGLEFCAALSDPNIRKALLTGVADEKAAVEAFNAGLIHRFIPKHAGQSTRDIYDFVDVMQQDYFAQYSARLKNTLAIDPPAFLTDRAVADFINRLMRKERLAEYYLAGGPPGLLMLTGDGRTYRLVVFNETELSAQADFAEAHDAPKGITRSLRAGKRIACLTGDRPDDYYGEESYDWSDKMLNAKRISGETGTYYAAVWPDMPADIDFDPSLASYNAYLATL